MGLSKVKLHMSLDRLAGVFLEFKISAISASVKSPASPPHTFVSIFLKPRATY